MYHSYSLTSRHGRVFKSLSSSLPNIIWKKKSYFISGQMYHKTWNRKLEKIFIPIFCIKQKAGKKYFPSRQLKILLMVCGKRIQNILLVSISLMYFLTKSLDWGNILLYYKAPNHKTWNRKLEKNIYAYILHQTESWKKTFSAPSPPR